MDEIAKAFMDIALDPTWGGGLTAPHMTPPPAARVIMLTNFKLWHTTQSFMKNGGQQKCLDKALSGKEIVGCYNLY